jgi:flavin reductase (DIM6/NTAB) family NADH-FMN oxidoreductase RutF
VRGKPGDKFVKLGFTRGQATVVNAPTVNEAPIQLECRLMQTLGKSAELLLVAYSGELDQAIPLLDVPA